MTDEKSDAPTLAPKEPSREELESAPTEVAPGSTPGSSTGFDTSARVGLGEVLGGRYRILEELGRGGEGVVYGALDLRADEVVALKLLRHDPSRLEGYRRELRMARRVTHENAVRIHDIVDLPGRFGLSMEFVRGETLEKRLARAGPMPLEGLLKLARDLASALGAAHAARVTHRDLKPSNVILRAGSDQAVVTDFGIARLVDLDDQGAVSTKAPSSRSRATTVGTIVGTPLYMAPEQLEGSRDVGPRADVYAFGLIVREAATARTLHEDAPALADLRALRKKSVPPLAAERADLPAPLTAFVDRCLAPKPEDRFGDGGELLRALRALNVLPSGSHIPEVPPTRRRIARGLAGPLAVVVSLVAVGVAVAGLSRSPKRSAEVGAASATGSVSLPSSVAIPPFHPTGAHRITFGATCDEFPSFTPDGTSVVFDRTVGGSSNIMWMSLADGSTRAITKLTGWNTGPSVSPDGRRIAFEHVDGKEDGAFVSLLDGPDAPRLLTTHGGHPAWAADGRSVWVGSDQGLVRYDAESGEAIERLESTPGFTTDFVQDLGGGRLIALAGTAYSGEQFSLMVRDRDGPWRRLFEGRLQRVLTPWPDRDHALVSRIHPDTLATDLFLVALDGSAPQPLTATGIVPRTGLDVSSDNRSVVWSTCAQSIDLVWLTGKRAGTPLPTDGADMMGGEPLGSSSSIAVLSTRGGPLQPWVIDMDGHDAPRSLPIGDHRPTALSTSTDGRWVLLTLASEGLLIVPSDGSASATFLARGLTGRSSMAHEKVYFERELPAGGSQIVVTDRGGGAERVVVAENGRNPIALADGRLMYLDGPHWDHLRPVILDPTSGAKHPLSPALTEATYFAPCASPDGRRLALLTYPHDVTEVDVATGSVTRRMHSDEDIHEVSCVRGDILATRYLWQGSVWLADLVGSPAAATRAQ